MINTSLSPFFQRHKFLISMGAMIVTGALLRIQGIDRPLTADPSGMFLMHYSTSWDSLLLNYRDTNQRTLYIFLAKISMGILGENEFAFRLPAFMAGLLALPLAYKVGMLMTNSRAGAWIGTFILTFSIPHITHTQVVKGYSLTVFLSLAIVFIAYKLLDRKNFKLWGILFLLTGLGMILIVPSNVHFLVGIGVFYLVVIVINYIKSDLCIVQTLKLICPLFALFGIVGGYFLYILSDLKRAIASNQNYYKLFDGIDDLSFNLERFIEVLISLISPWSTWLYVFLFFGLVRLYKTNGFFLFISLFILPLVLVLLSGLLGPPRVYIYWLPFILLLIGFGMAELIIWTKTRFSNLAVYYMGILTLAIIILYPLTIFFENPSHLIVSKDRTTIKEAISAKVFIENNGSKYDLIVIPYSDRVLRYYLEEHIAHNMLNILRDGRLKKILFLGSSKIPPHEFPNVGGISSTYLMKNHSFKLIHEIGNLSVYDLGLTIKKISPSDSDRDYENNTQFKHDKSTKIEHIDQPKIAGSKALKVINWFSGREAVLLSKESGSIDVLTNESYILTNFARGYQKLSQSALLHQKEKVPPGFILLNIYYGVFASKNSNLVWKRIDLYKNFFVQPDESEKEEIDFIWEIVFTIYPVPKGKLGFSTGLRSPDHVGYFDGFQAFILEVNDIGD